MSSEHPFSSRFAWPAPAKINRFLHVTGRRDDGYHTLQTLFQFIDLQDDLRFTARGDGAFVLHGAPAALATDDNLILRAARLIQRVSGAPLGAEIHLTKRIPVGGGLGGGSSDAATTLVALNRLWNLGFPTDELADLGTTLGADVPVFVRGTAAWGEGIGERLSPVAAEESWLVLAMPAVSIPTAAVFADPALPRRHPPVTWDDYTAGRCGNDCEDVVCARYPDVARTLDLLRAFGPARLSGTGACVFLPCATEADARRIEAGLPDDLRRIITRGLNHSPLAAIMRGL